MAGASEQRVNELQENAISLVKIFYQEHDWEPGTTRSGKYLYSVFDDIQRRFNAEYLAIGDQAFLLSTLLNLALCPTRQTNDQSESRRHTDKFCGGCGCHRAPFL